MNGRLIATTLKQPQPYSHLRIKISEIYYITISIEWTTNCNDRIRLQPNSHFQIKILEIYVSETSLNTVNGQLNATPLRIIRVQPQSHFQIKIVEILSETGIP